ncbi:MAG: hypothetical protein ACKOWL_02830 [Sphingobacteriaceae bacterium]
MQATEELEELIAHKLRFLSKKTSVVVLGDVAPLQVHSSFIFEQIAQKIGAVLLPVNPVQAEAMVLIGCLSGKSLAEAMNAIPQILQIPYLQANDKNRAYLLHEEWFLQADALLQLECLAEIVYPNFFTFGHQGIAWVEIRA